MPRKSSSREPIPSQPLVNDAKRAVLDKALGDILKRYGDGSIMRLGEAHSMTVETIPTGSLSLDIALGVGGIPRGRITEIYGPESSGKTTICQHIVAEVQKIGGTAAYIDMEHALDPVYAARTGVDIDNLLVSQPDTGEQALEITETLVRSGAVDIVVINSVAALVPRSELEGDMGDATMGVQARLMSQALRKLSGAINQTKTSVVFTNQLRQKIGVMFGNPGNNHRWSGIEVLCFRPVGCTPHPGDQTGRGNHRQPDQGPSCEEQGRPTFPDCRIRHHVQRGHLQSWRYPGPCYTTRDHPETRCFLLLWRPAPGSGT